MPNFKYNGYTMVFCITDNNIYSGGGIKAIETSLDVY